MTFKILTYEEGLEENRNYKGPHDKFCSCETCYEKYLKLNPKIEPKVKINAIVHTNPNLINYKGPSNLKNISHKQLSDWMASHDGY